MFDNRPTRPYPGLVNLRDTDIFSDLYVPDRTILHEYEQDFDQYVAGDWTVTGAGSAALAAGDGGILHITSPVSTFQSIQKNPANFQMVAGYRAWLRLILSLDSLLGNTLNGLMNVTATPFTGASQTDGFWFTTDVATGEVKGVAAVGGVLQTVDLNTQIVAGQFARFSAYYDGECYAAAPNGRVVFEAQQINGQGVTANSRAEILLSAAFPGVTLLSPTMAVNASTAVARVLAVDLFYGSKDRVNINATPPF